MSVSRVIALGAGHLFETVEADIEGKEAGDTGSVVVPAEEAFGEYDEGEGAEWAIAFPEGVSVIDLSYRFVSVNPAFIRTYWWSMVKVLL